MKNLLRKLSVFGSSKSLNNVLKYLALCEDRVGIIMKLTGLNYDQSLLLYKEESGQARTFEDVRNKIITGEIEPEKYLK